MRRERRPPSPRYSATRIDEGIGEATRKRATGDRSERRPRVPKRQMTFPAGRYFHVYNRGLNHAQVFFSARNYIYFLELLKRNIDRYGITVTA